jgi:hypothetical protein
MNPDDTNKPDPNEPGAEDFDVNSLAESLLGGAKEEEKKADEKDKGEEPAKPEAGAEEKPAEGEKPADDKDKKDDEKPEDKPADKPAEGDAAAEKSEEKPGDSAEENKPLTREDIRAAMREEQQARDDAANQRSTYSGAVRDTIREDLKLDSTYTTVALDDGTPITSVEQLTSVINPSTDEPYTREEAATLLLDARKIVDDNMKAYESRVDELTDLNVSFKEQADEVDHKFGDILKAFPDVAQDLLKAYQKTFTMSADGKYVTNVPIPPMEFYAPVLGKFRTATDQVTQKEADEKAATEKVERDAKIKAEQEDRGDLNGSAGDNKAKPSLLEGAIDKYLAG